MDKTSEEKLRLHKLSREGKGIQYTNLSYANLCFANLSGADLSGANLKNVIGNGKEIKTLIIGTYHISYTSNQLAIGCEQHSHDIWRAFTDNEISNMDSDALDWWDLNKELIFTLLDREK